MKLRVLLADDHNMVRQGFRMLLDREPDFELVGEVENGLHVEAKVARHRPDVLILDVKLPGLPGLEVLQRVRLRHPRTFVVMVSMHTDEAYVLKALDYGASGYVSKSADADELVKAVREAGAGREYLSEPFKDLSVEAVRRKAAGRPIDRYESLTRREKEVLQSIAEAHTNKQTADRLSIDERTVETHRANIMRKLKLKNVAELVRFAVEWGLIELQGPPPPGLESNGEDPPPGPRGDTPPPP